MIDLRKLNGEGCTLTLKDIDGTNPYHHTLEYSAPSRGVWNIVHISLLLPESHQVFVCSVSCMRGVVLTAAEVNAQDRFSSIFITEMDLLSGGCEQLIIDGVTELISNLPKRPKAMSIFTACIDEFMGTDHEVIFRTLEQRFPDVGFIECFMCPTMRKGSLPPVPTMNKNLFSLLKPSENKQRAVNFIGNNIPLPHENEFVRMMEDGGYKINDIGSCKTFDEYQAMAQSVLNIMINPSGEAAVESLKERLGQEALRIPVSYDFAEIESDLKKLANALDLAMPDTERLKSETVDSIKKTLARVGEMPIALDYMATSRPFGLARLLKEYGFNVVSIYADVCSDCDLSSFEWLKKNAGDITWKFPYHPKMAVLPRTAASYGNRVLAIGQDAAYFTGTKHFVNVVESDGLYGFHGIRRLMELIGEAAENEKDTRRLIQVKGLGCCG